MSKNYPDELIDPIAAILGPLPDGDYDWVRIEKLCDVAVAYANDSVKRLGERIAEDVENAHEVIL